MRTALLFPLLLAAVAAQSTKDIVDLGTELGATTLVSYIETAGLTATLKGQGPFTVFAPTNAAFAALPQDLRDALAADPARLSQVLQYHVVDANVSSSQLTDNQLTASKTGVKIRFNIYTKDGGQVITASGCQVSSADNYASNGVIHVVNKVLLAPVGNIVVTAQNTSDLSTLVTQVTTAGLVNALSGSENSPLTVFAPTNAAFTAAGDLGTNITALAEVLKYHVTAGAVYSAGISGGEVDGINAQDTRVFVSVVGANVYVNDAQVESADTTATNGVVHKINKVLMPPRNDIVELAVAQGLSELASAVTAADLVNTLKGTGPFTVFAPTNAAFTAAGIDMNDIPALKKVLQYHVVSGATYSFGLSNGQTITTVEGSTIDVSISGSTVSINDATVTIPNVQANNGAVHVIDKVLTIPSDNPSSASALGASLALALLSAVWRLL